MPHFIIDCSENILKIKESKTILQAVFETAFSIGLFEKNDIKVRLNPYKYSLVQSGEADFIHIFGNIMEGRTGAQKAKLSKLIVSKLKSMFQEVPVISINIRDFDKTSYCNRNMV